MILATVWLPLAGLFSSETEHVAATHGRSSLLDCITLTILLYLTPEHAGRRFFPLSIGYPRTYVVSVNRTTTVPDFVSYMPLPGD